MKLLTMELSPSDCNFLSLRPKYSQRFLLELSQSLFLKVIYEFHISAIQLAKP
jgi:hypothetical protein